MNTTKTHNAPAWTPGPWQIVRRHPDAETAKNYVEILGPNQCGANGPGYSTAIAEIYCASGNVESANARLIAAAPGMAEVLATMMEQADAQFRAGAQHATFNKQAIEQVRAALNATLSP